MKHTTTYIAATALIALLMQGCTTTPQAQAPAEPAKPTLSAEAQAALTQAEADVKAAKAAEALWTNAEDALTAAQDAAKEFDSATVLKKAKSASDFAKMGLAQKDYPSTEPK